MPVGSQVLSITNAATGSVAITYIANKLDFKSGSTPITRKTEFAIPSAETLLVMPFTGSAQLQLATWDTISPDIGAQFTFKGPGAVSLHAKVTSFSPKYEAGGETFVDIEFNKMLNPAS